MSSSSISSSSSSSSFHSQNTEAKKPSSAARLDWAIQELQSLSLQSFDSKEKAPIIPASSSLQSVEELIGNKNFKSALKEARKIENLSEKGMAFYSIAEGFIKAEHLEEAKNAALEGFTEDALDPYDLDSILEKIALKFFEKNKMNEMLSVALEMQTDFLKKKLCLFLLNQKIMGPAETIFYSMSQSAERETVVLDMIKKWASKKHWDKCEEYIGFLPETSYIHARVLSEIEKKKAGQKDRNKPSAEDKKRIREEFEPCASIKMLKSNESQRISRAENEPNYSSKPSSKYQENAFSGPADCSLRTKKSCFKKPSPPIGTLSSFIHSEKSEKEELSPLSMPSQKKEDSSDGEMMDVDFLL